MNILYIINYAGKGGSEKYVEILSERFKESHNIFFVYNENGPLVERMKEMGITSFKLQMENIFDKKAIGLLADYCEENEIDIIHAQFPRENFIALSAKKLYPRLKVIYTSHINIENNFLWKILNKIKTKQNDAIISVCTKNKELLIENGYPEEKIKVIFNGHEYKERALEKSTKVREEFKISPDNFIFTIVTRFTEEKGTDFLLESIHKYKELGGDLFKVLIVGDGPLEEELKTYAEELDIRNQVLFLGYRNDIDEILQGSDCYINSSNSEALSISILEALSHSLPIIATKVGGNPDIVNSETGCGILVRYGSTAAMARAMEKLQWDEDFYKKASANALFTLKNKFNLEDTLNETYNIYKKVME